MSRVTHLPIETPPARARRRPPGAINAVILAIGFVMLGFTPVNAGSATAQFRVSAQVVNSCKVSAETLASQAANGTIKVNCQNSAAPAGTSGSADGVGGGTANVNYSVVEVPGSDGGLKIITVNY